MTLQQLLLAGQALELDATFLVLLGLLRGARLLQLLHTEFSLGIGPVSVYDDGVFNCLPRNLCLAKP